MMPNLVSVIIPVYNDKTNLSNCLASLYDTGYKGFEVIVVDDGSADEPQSLAKNFPFKVVKFADNKGQACARNAGVRESGGDIVLFTDSDCVVMKDWVMKMAEELIRSRREGPNIAAIYGKVLSGSGFIEKCEAYTGYAYVQGGIRMQANNLNTACAAVYRDAFWKVGGFSEDLKVGEDSDLAMKLSKNGYRVIYEPSVSVFHYHGIKTFKEFLLKQKRWGEALGLRFERRYRDRLGFVLPLLSNPLLHFILILPLAFITTAKIIFYNMKSDKKIILYSFFVFLGKISFRWGVFIAERK